MKTFSLLLFVLCFLININANAQDLEWRTFKKDKVKFSYTEADKGEIGKIVEFVGNGTQTIKKFFGNEFPKEFEVKVLPALQYLTVFWRKDWNETQCWMVARGKASKLTILSPRVWKKEACEHNPDDVKQIQLMVTNELAQVFHGQISPNPNFNEMNDISWFVEGLAVYVSGHLDETKLDSPREAIEKGLAPTELEKAWTGEYRYGVCGSIVRFIDRKFGRRTILQMLKGTQEKELLNILRLTETDLLKQWKESFLAGK